MRSLRWLLLVVIAVIAAGVFRVYRLEQSARKASQRPTPAAMSLTDKADAVDWEWGQSAQGRPQLKLTAKEMRQATDAKTSQLEKIELRIYQKNGKSYDRVRSDHAEFTSSDNRLYAPGEAEITLDVPVAGDPKHVLTSIKAAGINFDSQTGKAVTDKHVAFTFENGNGVCDGASYDPQTHEIHLMHGVVVNLKSKDPKGHPMKVETEELVYSETASTVNLGPWSRLTRDQMVMASGATTVHLKNKKLDSIDAPSAKGTDKQEGKDLEYSADMVKAWYNEHGEMERLEATGNAHLVSHAKTSDTTMTGTLLNMFFNATAKDSVLSSVQARGNAFLESKPATVPGVLTPDTKDIRADSVDVFMKPDGKELERVSTLSPGTMEFLPNQAAKSRRLVKSDRMTVRYGAKNEIESYHADAASTETHPSQQEIAAKKKPANQIAMTSSKTLDATFDDKGQLKQILQTGNFHYAEGVRKAQSDTAVMDNAKNLMDLDAHARISDDTGSTAANHIQIDQATGDFDARGKVETTRLSDQKPAPAPDPKAPAAAQQTTAQKSADQGGMLDPGEAMQGKADHVVSAKSGPQSGSLIHYIGNAIVWQGASRIMADNIDIDRKAKSLTAEGHVVSQLQDAAKTLPDGKPGPTSPVTVVRAQKLVYNDTNRLAIYSGDVSMVRAGLTVKCATLQAYMNDGKPVDGKTPDSRIDRALADGKVEVLQVALARQRIGTSEHGEYYTEEGKIVLTGGRPHVKDSKTGDSTGENLTYFTNDDRIVIDGSPKKIVEGHIVRGKS
jgi:lipopolysaccharide export system protein LptA